jgi:succinate dehydrogenase / fumarate reductase membrane anchor subunit
MIANRPLLKSHEGFGLWLLKMLSAVFILVILGIHLVVNHFTAEGGLLSYNDILIYFQNPLIPIMEGTFLVTVVVHSLLGFRSILLDLKPKPGTLQVINWVLGIVGVVSIGYGIWLLTAIVAAGRAL